MMKRLLLVLAAIACLATMPAAVLAQTTPTTLVIPKASTDLLSAGHSGGYVDAFADGALCGRLTFADTTQRNDAGDHVLRLDSPGAPAPCGTSGATLALVNGLGQTLATRRALVAGQANVIQSLAPEAPSANGTPSPQPPGTGLGLARGESGRATAMPVVGITFVLVGLGVGVASGRKRR